MDLTTLLARPPADNAPQTADELALLHGIEARRTPEAVAAAQADEADESVFLFATVLGQEFRADRLPHLTAFFEKVKNDISVLGKQAKLAWHRPRPATLDPTLHPVGHGASGSYPSGHALLGWTDGLILAHMLPERRADILRRARDYAGNRLVCGVHFPSDIEASRAAATVIVGQLAGSAAFRAEAEAALRELREVLPVAAAAAGEPVPDGILSWSVGGPDRWDYLAVEPDSGRIFIAHDSEVTVVDGRTGAPVGNLAGLGKAHGVAFVGRLHRGYVTEQGGVTAFDLDTLATLGHIETGAGADTILFDGASGRLMVMNGKAGTVAAVDPDRNAVVATVAVGGKPEAAVADGRGAVFVNVESRAEIVRLDSRTMTLDARIALPDCQAPHGLDLDPRRRRLFASCANSRMLVVDADDGRVAASLPIGRGSDGVVWDAASDVAFSANGDGSLSRIGVDAGGQVVALAPIATRPGARTLALDPLSGRLYLAAATLEGGAGTVVPGSFGLLVLEARMPQ
jgi:YVTN family beta-propeller protein